jgi:hypothetical protein
MSMEHVAPQQHHLVTTYLIIDIINDGIWIEDVNICIRKKRIYKYEQSISII